MFPIIGTPLIISDLTSGPVLTDDEIIVWHDGPRAFTSIIKEQLYIFWEIDQDYAGRSSRFLMVKSTTENITDLVESKKPVLDCLKQDEVYIWDMAYDYATPCEVLVCKWDDLPKENLPKPGIFLTIDV